MGRMPIVATMQRVPGGMMLIPLLIGSLVRTFAPGFLELGSFTSALFRDSALPLIALLIFATGAQINLRQSGRVLAKTGVVVLMKTVIPGLLIIACGYAFGLEGVLGVSVVVAVLPFIIGFVLGNLDEKFAEMLKPASAITVPFFAFALGAGIDLRSLAVGGVTGIWLGLAVSVITGALTYLGYRWLLGERSAVGFAAGTTAGNSVATPAIVAQADAAFAPYVAVAAA